MQCVIADLLIKQIYALIMSPLTNIVALRASQLMNKCPTTRVDRDNKPPPRYTLHRIWTARKLEKRRDIFQIVAVGECKRGGGGPPTSAVMRLL